MKKAIAQHIDETDFLVVDVETTGLSSDAGDRVCEVGAVRLRGCAVLDTFGSLVDPRRPISAGAYAVNRISPQMLTSAPQFSSIAEKLWEMMQHSVLVAYNAPFDLSFIVNEFRLIGFPPIRNVVVDALAIARKLLPGLGKYPQENVAQVLGISFPVQHRATEDAIVTAKIFTLFMSILKAYDLTSVSDLLRQDLLRDLSEKRLSILQQALDAGGNLWLKYLSASNGEITDRVVTPKQLTLDASARSSATCLRAYCHAAKAERSFRVDRILDLRVVKNLTSV